LGAGHESSFAFSEKRRRSFDDCFVLYAAPHICRHYAVYQPQLSPHIWPHTIPEQEERRAILLEQDNLRYASSKMPATGLPVGFCH